MAPAKERKIMKKLLIISALMVSSYAVLYASDITPTASVNTTTTASESVSRTAANADAAGSTLGAVCLPEDQYMQMQMKELHLNVTPSFEFVLPDTDFKISLLNKFDLSQLEASTEYNYLYSRIYYMLKYSLSLFFQPFVSLYDDTDFEKIYANGKFIQRTRGLSGGVKLPMIFDLFLFSAEGKNENFYFANLQDNLNVNQGNINLFNFRMEVFDKKRETSDYYFQADVEKSIPADNSDYNFMFLNIDANKTLKFQGNNFISDVFQAGYLLQQSNVPEWKLYNLGGYAQLAGYSFDEFQGYYKIFNRLKLDVECLNDIGWKLTWKQYTAEWSTVDVFATFDAGCVGSSDDIQNINRYHFSAGIGLRFGCMLGKSKMYFTFMLAKALYSNSLPFFYYEQEF